MSGYADAQDPARLRRRDGRDPRVRAGARIVGRAAHERGRRRDRIPLEPHRSAQPLRVERTAQLRGAAREAGDDRRLDGRRGRRRRSRPAPAGRPGPGRLRAPRRRGVRVVPRGRHRAPAAGRSLPLHPGLRHLLGVGPRHDPALHPRPAVRTPTPRGAGEAHRGASSAGPHVERVPGAGEPRRIPGGPSRHRRAGVEALARLPRRGGAFPRGGLRARRSCIRADSAHRHLARRHRGLHAGPRRVLPAPGARCGRLLVGEGGRRGLGRALAAARRRDRRIPSKRPGPGLPERRAAPPDVRGRHEPPAGTGRGAPVRGARASPRPRAGCGDGLLALPRVRQPARVEGRARGRLGQPPVAGQPAARRAGAGRHAPQGPRPGSSSERSRASGWTRRPPRWPHRSRRAPGRSVRTPVSTSTRGRWSRSPGRSTRGSSPPCRTRPGTPGTFCRTCCCSRPVRRPRRAATGMRR